MAYPSSTKKRIRQAKKRNLRNRHFKSMMKTLIKRVEEAPTKEEALKWCENHNCFNEAEEHFKDMIKEG